MKGWIRFKSWCSQTNATWYSWGHKWNKTYLCHWKELHCRKRTPWSGMFCTLRKADCRRLVLCNVNLCALFITFFWKRSLKLLYFYRGGGRNRDAFGKLSSKVDFFFMMCTPMGIPAHIGSLTSFGNMICQISYQDLDFPQLNYKFLQRKLYIFGIRELFYFLFQKAETLVQKKWKIHTKPS